MPNAFFYINNKKVKIKKSFIGSESGVVLHEVDINKYIISTKDGIILIETDTKLKVGDKIKQ